MGEPAEATSGPVYGPEVPSWTWHHERHRRQGTGYVLGEWWHPRYRYCWRCGHPILARRPGEPRLVWWAITDPLEWLGWERRLDQLTPEEQEIVRQHLPRARQQVAEIAAAAQRVRRYHERHRQQATGIPGAEAP